MFDTLFNIPRFNKYFSFLRQSPLCLQIQTALYYNRHKKSLKGCVGWEIFFVFFASSSKSNVFLCKKTYKKTIFYTEKNFFNSLYHTENQTSYSSSPKENFSTQFLHFLFYNIFGLKDSKSFIIELI
ncbi:MAG: hypothetical protein CSA05_01375 [Bacteroidia bacterium]|nr:MAG: hypothetical protein CSA05_01375 [Bacteroidia bacterium]